MCTIIKIIRGSIFSAFNLSESSSASSAYNRIYCHINILILPVYIHSIFVCLLATYTLKFMYFMQFTVTRKGIQREKSTGKLQQVSLCYFRLRTNIQEGLKMEMKSSDWKTFRTHALFAWCLTSSVEIEFFLLLIYLFVCLFVSHAYLQKVSIQSGNFGNTILIFLSIAVHKWYFWSTNEPKTDIFMKRSTKLENSIEDFP